MPNDVLEMPCEEFLTGYKRMFYVLYDETIHRCIHEGIVLYCCLPAVRFQVIGIDSTSIFITPGEWKNRVFNLFEDAEKFLAGKHKFGKWYRCEDTLPDFVETVIVRTSLNNILCCYRKRVPCDEGWLWQRGDMGIAASVNLFPKDVKLWMPLPTGDEPVEEINN